MRNRPPPVLEKANERELERAEPIPAFYITRAYWRDAIQAREAKEGRRERALRVQ